MGDQYQASNNDGEDYKEATFGFSILDTTLDVVMKNIPPSILPNFHGLATEDPDAFLFEFDTLYHSYNYNNHGYKLKLFLATLRDSTLRCFMGLVDYFITTWDDLKKFLPRKNHNYCKTRNIKENIFNVQQSEEESLEDYVETFLYNLQKTK